MNNDQLFPLLCTHFNASPGKKNEAHVDCPFCGSKAGNQINPHASFSPKGFKCFSCGTGKSLKALWEHIGHPAYKTPDVPIKPLPEAKKTPFKLSLDQYQRDYYLTPDVVSHWQAYKPIPEATIRDYQLGYGVLPRSACKHPRLIVPIFGRDGQIVHLRGRRVGCDCESKWTVSGGWSMESLEPYNSQCVKPIVLIVENPIDALMISSVRFHQPVIRLLLPGTMNTSVHHLCEWRENMRSDYPISAIATFSVAYWREGWSDYLENASQIIVAYDNDLPGNGGSVNRDRFIAEWRRDIPNRPIPKASGVTLVNRLRHEGLPATLLDWGNRPVKFDIGSLLTKQ